MGMSLRVLKTKSQREIKIEMIKASLTKKFLKETIAEIEINN